jgi:hypothetical protein
MLATALSFQLIKTGQWPHYWQVSPIQKSREQEVERETIKSIPHYLRTSVRDPDFCTWKLIVTLA